MRNDAPSHSTAEGSDAGNWLEDALTRDPVLGRVFAQLRRLAAGDGPVLLYGEAGTGREPAARAIHNLSSRAAHPFVVIDCASISESMIEPELLGVDAAGAGKVGVFEQAGHGTVLLSEVGELPARLQEAVLQVLDRHEIRRVNGTGVTKVDARCLASTSIDLRTRIAAGLFRDDLHARLANERLELPSLRERPDDIIAFARTFLEQCCAQLPRAARDFTPEAEAALRAYRWPHNVRELREVVETAALHARHERIGVEDLPDTLRTDPRSGQLPSLRDVEIRHIERVLQEARGNQRRASRILGISRWSLSRRLRKYGLQPRGEE